MFHTINIVVILQIICFLLKLNALSVCFVYMCLLHGSDYFLLAVFENWMKVCEALVWLNFFNKIGFVWVTVCSSMVTNFCITSRYHITSHSDACFDPEANLVNMLWCMDSYILDASCHQWNHDTTWSPSSLNPTFPWQSLHRLVYNHIYTVNVFLLFIILSYVMYNVYIRKMDFS